MFAYYVLVVLLYLVTPSLAWCPLTFRPEDTFSLGIDDNGITCHHHYGMCAVQGSPHFDVFMDVLKQKYGRGVRNNDCAGLVRRPWSRDGQAPFVELPTEFIRLTRFALKFELALNTSLEENAFTELPTLEEIELVDVSKLASRCITSLNELHKVTFRDMRLERFPRDTIFKCPKVRTIQISKTKITRFEDSAFSTLTNLIELNFKDSRIKFADYPFVGLTRLTTLTLNYLDLNQIQRSWFTPLINLKYLELIHNNLKVIDSDVFSHLSKLISLKLKFNLITNVQNRSFDNLGELSLLDLSNNRLVNMVHISGANKLKYIQADNNRIDRISSNAYCSLPLFEVISLEHNPIDRLNMVRQDNCFNRKAVFVAKFGFISHEHHKQLRTIPQAYDFVLKDLLTCDCEWNWIQTLKENHDDEYSTFAFRKCNQTNEYYEHPTLRTFLKDNCIGLRDLRIKQLVSSTTTELVSTVTEQLVTEASYTPANGQCSCPQIVRPVEQGRCSTHLVSYEACLVDSSATRNSTASHKLEASITNSTSSSEEDISDETNTVANQ